MLRRFRLTLGMVVVLATAATEARAQYYPGYGAWGWGGWGGTVQGDIARGLGLFDAGLGALREETAIANTINEAAVQRWNQYLYLSQQEANRREYLRRMRQAQEDAKSGDLVYDRLRNHPTPEDIENGAALNVILDEVTDPRIQSSALRLANTPLDSKVIKAIPFQNASSAIAISLKQLTAQGELPLALQGERFGPERLEYQQAIDQALQEEEQEGKISPATLERVDRAVGRLHAKLRMYPPSDRAELIAAENYIKALYGMTRMLEQPKIDKVLAELDETPNTTVGNLLGFMHTYNLRFGEATTPAQRDIYQHLYPLMVDLRDKVAKAAGNEPPAAARGNQNRPVDFFQGMSLESLSGKRSNQRPVNQ